MAHVGQKLALGDAGGLGAGHSVFQVVLGDLAFGDVFGDRQQVIRACLIADQHLSPVEETHAAGGPDRILLIGPHLAALDHFAVLSGEPLGLVVRKDLVARLADVIARADPVDHFDRRIYHQQAPAARVLDRDSGRDAGDHRLQEGARAPQLFRRHPSLGDVLGDGQQVVRPLVVPDQRLALVEVAHARGSRHGLLLEQPRLSGLDDLAVVGAEARGQLGGEHVLVGQAEVLARRADAIERGGGLVRDHQTPARGFLHRQAGRKAVDDGFQEGAGPLELVLGVPGLGDILADRQQKGGASVVADGHLGLAEDPGLVLAGKRQSLLEDDGFARFERDPVLLGQPLGDLGGKQLVHGPADVILGRDGIELLHGPVHHQHAAGVILDHQGQGRMFQDHGGKGAAVACVVLRLHLGADVVGGDQQPADPARSVAPGAGIPLHPPDPAVGRDDPLRLAGQGLARKAALVQMDVPVPGLRGQVIGAAADQLRLRQPEVRQPSGTDLQEAQAAICHRHGERRILDKGLDGVGPGERRLRGRSEASGAFLGLRRYSRHA